MNPNTNPNVPTAPEIEFPADAIMPPTVDTSMSAEVPSFPYVCLLLDGEFKKSENSGNLMIVLDFQVISPDVVPSGKVPGKQIQVAGRKFNMYAVVDPNAKAQSSGYEILTKLGLIHPSGAISPSFAVNEAKKKNRFAIIQLESETDYMRGPKLPGMKEAPILMHPVTGEQLVRGERIKLPGSRELVGLTQPPEGYVGTPY